MNLPPAIAHYLITLATQQRDLAYLCVTPKGQILSSGGTLTKYRLDIAKVGDAIDQHLVFLDGFFPHPDENEVMPHIQTEQGDVIDVHFIAGGSQLTDTGAHSTASKTASQAATASKAPAEQWILLLDATAEIKQQQQFQQTTNDLALLRQRVTKHIDQAHHQSLSLITQRASERDIDSNTAQKISVLIIKICQSPFNLARLNDCFADITQLVLDENGLVHHVFGPTAIVLFGLAPTSQAPAVQAIRAAQRLLNRCPPQAGPQLSTTAKAAANEDMARYQMGMSITTGDATIGTIHYGHQQTLNVDGPAISTACAIRDLLPLEGLCHSSSHHSLVVDAHTLQTGNSELSAFSTYSINRSHPPPLYQLIPK